MEGRFSQDCADISINTHLTKETPMHPKDEPASSSLKKGIIWFLVVAGSIFLAERIGFSETGIGVVGLIATVGIALYFTD